MENTSQAFEQVESWLHKWTVDPLHAKQAFSAFYDWLKAEGMLLEFKERPGISYSLRAKHPLQKDRPLFVLIDVVDDDAEERWLSVCFYADMIQDSKELGDFVPGGLMGLNALCLNLEEDDKAMCDYIQNRLMEAASMAKKY